MKTYTDAKRYAKAPKLHPEISCMSRKESPISVSLIKEKGPHSHTLTDGKTWDASHLSVLPETFTLPVGVPRHEEPAPSNGVPDRSHRNRKQPEWLKGYVT